MRPHQLISAVFAIGLAVWLSQFYPGLDSGYRKALWDFWNWDQAFGACCIGFVGLCILGMIGISIREQDKSLDQEVKWHERQNRLAGPMRGDNRSRKAAEMVRRIVQRRNDEVS